MKTLQQRRNASGNAALRASPARRRWHGFTLDRIARRHRDHRHPGGPAAAGAGPREGIRQVHPMPESVAPDLARHTPLRRGERGFVPAQPALRRCQQAASVGARPRPVARREWRHDRLDESAPESLPLPQRQTVRPLELRAELLFRGRARRTIIPASRRPGASSRRSPNRRARSCTPKSSIAADHVMPALCWLTTADAENEVASQRHKQKSNYAFVDSHVELRALASTFDPGQGLDLWNPSLAR